MKFLIMNRREMKNFINKIHPFTTGIITISDTDKNNINITNVCLVDGNKLARDGVHSFLPLKFDDVEKDSPTERAISKSDAEAIVKYINRVKNKVDCIAVNCEAGVSRSAGVCAAIMMALNGDDSEVFNDPSKCPNMRCYRTVLNEFAKNGYFDEDTKGISNEEIRQKELDNIEIWKSNLE